MKTEGYYFNVAKDACLQVGKYLLSEFGAVKEIFHKKDLHYGIKEDIKANQIFSKILRQKTPDIPIYSEEGEQSLGGKFVWLIDPIEGTSNYRVGNPFFATQICLLVNKQPTVSVVYAPKLEELFTAIKAKAAYLNGKKIKVSDVKDLTKAMIGIGKGTKRKDSRWWGRTATVLMNHVRTIRQFGATGLEMCYVGCGRLDAYLNSGSKIYDNSSGSLIVKEAGGAVLNHQGGNWSIEDQQLIAANSSLASKILKIISLN